MPASEPAGTTSATRTSSNATSTRSRLEPLRPGRLGGLPVPDLPSRQGSLRPQGDLCAWRWTVGHEGGLEHVGGPSAYRGGKGDVGR